VALFKLLTQTSTDFKAMNSCQDEAHVGGWELGNCL